MKKILFLLVGINVFLLSCKKTEVTSEERGTLLENEWVGSIPQNEVKDYIDEYDASSISVNDVEVIRITYVSESKGKNVKTNGILLRPKNADSVYFISYFHGTLIPLDVFGVKKSVPSLYNAQKEDFYEVRNVALAWASAGYTVFMPDYIGYGSTEKEEHPYIYYPELFKACIDGIKACKTYFNDQNLTYDNRIFLGGWSQGGGTSLSSHKFIQEAYSSEFQVVASSSLAGPHDCKEFLFDVFRNKDKEYPLVNIYSWALYSINKFSGLKRPNDQIWTYPVYDQASSFSPPSKIPAQLIRESFMHKLLSGEDAAMLAEINKNVFSEGWTPVGKVFLHHGDADDVVPYFNSERAKTGLTNAGGDVTLYTYSGGTHVSEVKNYVMNTLADFNLLK
jgi:dienelactone hydrolase